MRPIAVVLALLATGAGLAAVPGPTLTPEDQEKFLLTAKVVGSADIKKGTTRPVRLTLTDGTTTHDAAFSIVDERMPIMRFPGGRTELDFVDSYKYSIAAYRLAKLIGLDSMIPVTVERRIKGQNGSLSWWVDDVKWDEGERLKLGLKAPDNDDWNKQVLRMRLFTQLTADTDRNLGNLIITSDWKLWMIDFTRAFRRMPTPPAPAVVTRCDRHLLEKLRALTREQVTDATRSFLTAAEIAPLMSRRDALIAHVERLVATSGEDLVLY